MRWWPKNRRTRSIVAAGLGLLVVGGFVGAASLDDEGGGGGTRVVRASGSPGPAFLAVPEGDDGTNMLIVEGLDDSGNVSAPSPEAGMAMGSAPGGGGAGGGAASGGSAQEASLPPLDAGRVIKTATLEVEVDEKQFEAVHDRALREVSQAGGFVQSSTLELTRAAITFRVPADQFEAMLTRLRRLGTVKNETVSGEDVSEEYVDLEARLRHWQAQETVFLDLLSKARNVAETVEIRRELSNIQQTIEQLQGRIRFLDDRTGFSTVTLNLFVPGATPVPADDVGPNLSEAWEKAWDASVNVIGGTLIVLGAVLPLALVAGLVGLILWTGRRRRPPVASPAG